VNLPISLPPPPRPEKEASLPPDSEKKAPPNSSSPQFEESKESEVALFLQIFAYLELFASPIAGFALGTETSATVGWAVFITGFVGGLMLLGFSRLVQYGLKSTQHLENIEKMLKELIKKEL